MHNTYNGEIYTIGIINTFCITSVAQNEMQILSLLLLYFQSEKLIIDILL